MPPAVCAPRRKDRATKTCIVCGQTFEGCRPSKSKPPKYGSTCGDLCRAYLRYRRWPQCKLKQTPCLYCRKPLTVGRAYCNKRCRALYERDAEASQEPRRWYMGWCIHCGEPFVDNQPARIVCSPRCGRRHNKQRGKATRRARMRTAFVAPVHRARIYERDRWRCQICGKAVQQDAEVPHPLAPTIDHIIPLALGGTHEPSNVQLAHFKCNALKSHIGTGDQLLLIG